MDGDHKLLLKPSRDLNPENVFNTSLLSKRILMFIIYELTLLHSTMHVVKAEIS